MAFKIRYKGINETGFRVVIAESPPIKRMVHLSYREKYFIHIPWTTTILQYSGFGPIFYHYDIQVGYRKSSIKSIKDKIACTILGHYYGGLGPLSVCMGTSIRRNNISYPYYFGTLKGYIKSRIDAYWHSIFDQGGSSEFKIWEKYTKQGATLDDLERYGIIGNSGYSLNHLTQTNHELQN